MLTQHIILKIRAFLNYKLTNENDTCII